MALPLLSETNCQRMSVSTLVFCKETVSLLPQTLTERKFA